MKKSKYITAIFFMITLSLLSCQPVQKPEVKGKGPLAVVMERGVATPEYHAPMERWRAVHKKALANGDFSERECALCHNPKRSCNTCHGYIGTKEISIPEATLYWPAHEKEKKIN